MFKLSTSLDARYGRSDTWSYFVNLKNLATALVFAGEIRASLEQREQLMQRAAEFEPAGEAGLTNATNQAGILMRMAQPDAALSALQGTLEIARDSGNPAALIRVLNFVAGANIGVGKLPQAAVLLDEAVTLAHGPAGNDSIRSRVEKTRAELALAGNDAMTARRHIEQALALSGYRSDKPARLLGSLLTLAARIALQQDLPRDAEQFARDALALAEPVARGPETSADVGEALLQLGKASMASGAVAEAAAVLERSARCLSNALAADHPLTREARALETQNQQAVQAHQG
jgi:eukaryotic-like serine/threonine-protein kinase